MKTVYLKTYGCQMNVYDSERMLGALRADGYAETDRPETADLVVFNTCHIREHAAEKVYSELGRVGRMKARRARDGHEMLIAVAGCVAQAEGHEIIRRSRSVDLVVGPQSYHRLPDLIGKRIADGKAIVEAEFPAGDKFAALAPRPSGQRVSAFLTVQEGCDKFCSFCVVPYTRGAEFSRPVADVMQEARLLAEQGVREVTLLGQNVNAYHGAAANGEGVTLAGLITELSRIDGITRIRYTTSHPRDMTDDLIAAHAENEKLMPYLHLPVQSGSDRILKAMNRGHKIDAYLKLVEKIRGARPDMALSGDFIVGYPSEEEEDFQATLDVAREAGYASAYSFRYSPRPGTPAASAEGQVPYDVARERLIRLQAQIFDQQTAFNRSLIGQALEVLIEKTGRKAGQMTGRSPYLQPVHVMGPEADIGRIKHVIIDSVGTNSLLGHYPLQEVDSRTPQPGERHF
jgi:tRNA-2-methylthio-N6-dimethylallyladenosine synthase